MAPAVVFLLLLGVAGGRLSGAQALVEDAAVSGARAASLAPGPAEALGVAQTMVTTALKQPGADCVNFDPDTDVAVDTTRTSKPGARSPSRSPATSPTAGWAFPSTIRSRRVPSPPSTRTGAWEREPDTPSPAARHHQHLHRGRTAGHDRGDWVGGGRVPRTAGIPAGLRGGPGGRPRRRRRPGCRLGVRRHHTGRESRRVPVPRPPITSSRLATTW